MYGLTDCRTWWCRLLRSGHSMTRAYLKDRYRISRIIAVLAGAWLATATPAARPVAAEQISIGTGSTAGVYYQVGRAICALVAPREPELTSEDEQEEEQQQEREQQQEGEQDDELVCEAVATGGSIANLDALRGGDVEIAVIQSDVHYHAVHGSGPFSETGPYEDLRALFSVHGEPFTVVALRDSGIRTFDDLKGKRVNIGNPGSGQRATMEVVMDAKGWTEDDFELADELPADQQSLALCHNRVQAIVYTVGHPNESIGQATELCGAKIIEVAGSAIDKLVADKPYYSYTEIPGNMYGANAEPVRTFGVKATVVSSAAVDADTIYTAVEAVFDNLDRFRSIHPAFRALRPEAMISDGISAPLHDGAIRYFQEEGLLASDDPGQTSESE